MIKNYMKMNIETILCGHEREAFSKLFLFAVRYGFNSLIIVPDQVCEKRLEDYIRLRTREVYTNHDAYDGHGILISEINQVVDVGSFSSIGYYLLKNSNSQFVVPDCILKKNIPIKVVSCNNDYNNENVYWNITTANNISHEYPQIECSLENEDIREQFLRTFALAEHEIDIICPWINHYVVNERLENLIDMALKRNVRIKIIYGIGTGNDVRSCTSEATVKYLIKRFASFGDRIRFLKGNTHIKLLLCDNKYMMVGSYNFLSFAGEYNTENEREEAVEYIVDPVTIEQRRKRFFSW